MRELLISFLVGACGGVFVGGILWLARRRYQATEIKVKGENDL